MVQFFKESKSTPKAQPTLEVTITDVNNQGLGVTLYQKKPLFVPDALKGERVRVKVTTQNNKYQRGQLLSVLRSAEERVTPFCPYTKQCGGCSLQHMSMVEQRALKQRTVTQLFARAGFDDLPHLEWLYDEQPQGYRRVARLAIRRHKKGVALGFRQAQSHELVEIEHCGVLLPRLSALINPLRKLLNQLAGVKQLGHIELYDSREGVALLLRHTATLSAADITLLLNFAQHKKLALFLQDDQRRRPLHVPFALYYQLDDLTLSFTPGDFIQVNGTLNEHMVKQALQWLDATPTAPVLDLFCGVGNFSLPLAASGHPVVGIEGVGEMVEQARGNAEDNDLWQAQFYQADLAADFTQSSWVQQGFDHVLLDPGRAGAAEVIPYLSRLAPRRILYVSCNPQTLVKDSESLRESGYRLSRLGLIDMFAHTAHCEAMALFELD